MFDFAEKLVSHGIPSVINNDDTMNCWRAPHRLIKQAHSNKTVEVKDFISFC